ncbi:hypothetical protein [Chryseobacterium shigense]|uniref:LIVCS family branched-chain amino acid:cation transporter n=1 Tax=Chryseobacterium shigense TaxID=297244 RepID=A0A841NA21_9FLAO|nr:hypothetical protein [Chryseobacterium shigense]MBB6371903.1 LIVCS family branched-chain amino acid:cation transporter [Chryseobacterium shigense]
MKNDEIIHTGKCTFWLFFILGNICLFGYLITGNGSFAGGGFMLLIFGTIINLLLVIGLLIYGIASRSKLNACLKAIGLLTINIPIAYVYAVIGLSLN